jgi:hypothetical protein
MIDIGKAGTFTLARSNSAPINSVSVSSAIGPQSRAVLPQHFQTTPSFRQPAA